MTFQLRKKLGGGKLRPHKYKNKIRKNSQGGVVGVSGTKREAIDVHFRWDVLAELVRKKKGKNLRVAAFTWLITVHMTDKRLWLCFH